MRLVKRNYFGVLRVFDEPGGFSRTLAHGTTAHGTQLLVEGMRQIPLGYYHPRTPAGDAFAFLDAKGRPQKIAAIGLGLGSIACYARADRHFDFYEINPHVAEIAEDPEHFTYLSDCGSPYRIIPGDGRRQLAIVPDSSYDMIFLDAFISDTVPVHLLTREAFALYWQKLKPGGFIVAHLTNRYMSLQPIVAAIGRDLRTPALFRATPHQRIEADLA